MEISELLNLDIIKYDRNIIEQQSINIEKHQILIKKIALHIQPNYKFTNDINIILDLFMAYFSGQKNIISEFNKNNKTEISLSKGILLVGSVGSGKSLIFDIFKIYTSKVIHKNSFQQYQVGDIIDNLNIKGKIYFEKFSYNRSSNNIPDPITCYIDDIASRNEIVNHYGSVYNSMQELLTIRYNIFSKFRKLTHISTNLYPNQLKEIYGIRVIDRMKEMFNVVELKGGSFRK